MRRLANLAAVLMFAGCPVWAQNTGVTVRHRKVAEEGAVSPELTQAEAEIEKKDYAAAQPLLEKVLAADPKNFEGWFDLGFVDHGLGKTEDSIAAYRKSVAAKPDVFESNLNLGLVLAETGDPDAEKFLLAATQLKPTANIDEGHARAWLSLAHVLENTKPDEAIDDYKKAAALEPKDTEPLLSAGALLEKENRFAEAEQEYKLALGIDPNSDDALTGLANIYMRGQRFVDAEQVLRRVVAVRPADAAAHLQLGRVLAALNKNEDAIVELQTAEKLEPKNANLQRDLADLYSSIGKLTEADEEYSSLIEATPKDAELHHALGMILIKEHKYAEAERELLTAVKLKPDYGAAYGDLAAAASENKNYELAIKAADTRAKFLPEIPASYFLRASAYDHLHDYKQAAENYHKFLEVANGQYPDQEWQAKHRLLAIEPRR